MTTIFNHKGGVLIETDSSVPVIVSEDFLKDRFREFFDYFNYLNLKQNLHQINKDNLKKILKFLIRYLPRRKIELTVQNINEYRKGQYIDYIEQGGVSGRIMRVEKGLGNGGKISVSISPLTSDKKKEQEINLITYILSLYDYSKEADPNELWVINKQIHRLRNKLDAGGVELLDLLVELSHHDRDLVIDEIYDQLISSINVVLTKTDLLEPDIDILFKTIKTFLKTQINSIFTELLTNNIIIKDQFWGLINKIYHDLLDILQRIQVHYNYTNYNLADYSKLLVKGGNIMKLIRDQTLDQLKQKSGISHSSIDLLDTASSKFFKRSDIDFTLDINYKDSRLPDKETGVAILSKGYELFEHSVLELFDHYKSDTDFLKHFYPDIDYKEISREINTKPNLIHEIMISVDNIEIDSTEKREFISKVNEYLQKFKIEGFSIASKSPPDITIKTPSRSSRKDIVFDDTMDEDSNDDMDEDYSNEDLGNEEGSDMTDYVIDPDDVDDENILYYQGPIQLVPKRNKVSNTPFYSQKNEKLTFLVTHNPEHYGDISASTIRSLETEVSDFSLLRLFFKFDIKSKKRFPFVTRGEVIDLSINLPDDYFGPLIFQDSNKFTATYQVQLPDTSIFSFKGYSTIHIVNELIDILFGVHGENISITQTYKFAKRLYRLYFLIFVDILKEYQVNDILNFLRHLNTVVTSKKPLQFLMTNLETSKSGKRPILRRQSSRESVDGLVITGLVGSYLNYPSHNPITDEILRSSFYEMFLKLFRIYERLIKEISRDRKLKYSLIHTDNILIDELSKIMNNFYSVLTNFPKDIVPLQ